MRTALLSLLLLAPVSPAQADPVVPESFVFVARIGGDEIGRETVKLRADGWSCKGSFNVLGMQKGKYTASITYKGNDLNFEVTSDASGSEVMVIADYTDRKLTVRVPARKFKKSKTIKGPDPAFFFADLLWANMIDLGRILAAKDAAGTLEEGGTITALSANLADFAVVHLGTHTSTQKVKGKRVRLRVSKVRVPPGVEFVFVCTPAGIPLRIDVPAQKLTVEVVGFEGVRGSTPEPTSIVDSGPWRADLSQPTHSVTVERGVKMKMRDGVELVAEVYRPDSKRKFSAVLARTPYRREGQGALYGTWLAKRGYVYVAQDVRGRFGSGGDWFPFIHETKDGSDTIDWIAEQPWSNGKVGMIGGSYVGLVQWLAAKSGNPKLKCIVPQVSPPDPQQNFPYEGGAFLMGAAWWARVLDTMEQGKSWQRGLNWEKLYRTLPLGDLDQNLGIKEKTFLDTWLQHPPHEVEFWGPAMYQHMFGEMDLPAFHISGWYDGDMPGAIENFPGMRQHGKTEHARNSQYLVMGPWTHFFNTSRTIGHVDFGDEGTIDLDARILRFFDRYLKGMDNGIDKEPRVHTFTMGTNKWHGASDWPIPNTKWTKLHLGSDGNALKRDGDGRLALAVTAGTPSDTFAYDPTKLMSLDGINFTDTSGAYATADKTDDPDRDDDLNYTSPPLAGPCEIVGPVSLVLWVSTDAADTDFACAVYRLTADGKRYALRGGVQRLRYATNPLKDTPVPPGTVTRVEIDCWATGQRLDKGDRIQVVISSSAWPGYGRNMNTLEDQLTATKPVIANNTVYHDTQRPSHLLLPVVPRKDASGLRFEK